MPIIEISKPNCPINWGLNQELQAEFNIPKIETSTKNELKELIKDPEGTEHGHDE